MCPRCAHLGTTARTTACNCLAGCHEMHGEQASGPQALAPFAPGVMPGVWCPLSCRSRWPPLPPPAWNGALGGEAGMGIKGGAVQTFA